MSLGQNDNAILKLLADEELRKENAALAAENERLRKAGDAVVLCLCGYTNEKHKERCAINWLAAKEGRDTK